MAINHDEPAKGRGTPRGIKDPKGLRPPCLPTKAIPGSEEKVRVLIERARLGQPLWHPEDSRALPRDDGHDNHDNHDNHTEENDE